MNILTSGLKKIALVGKANSGKNTTAQLIAEKFCPNPSPYNFEYNLLAFADPIKEIIIAMFPWADRECLYGPSKKRANIIANAYDSLGNPLTYRQALIDIGTQGRAYNKDHWINVFKKRIDNLPSQYFTNDQTFNKNLIVCTDVRFRNEFDFLKNQGFFIIKIMRNSEFVLNHATETNQDQIAPHEFNLIIDNNGSLEDLKALVNKIEICG